MSGWIEVYKALNNISPSYMSQLFKHSQIRPLNLFVSRVNQTTFGLKSVRYEGIILWNSLPEHIKVWFPFGYFLPFVARFGFSYQRKATTSNAMLKWKHPQKTKTSNKKP